jgi:hypothetical protein
VAEAGEEEAAGEGEDLDLGGGDGEGLGEGEGVGLCFCKGFTGAVGFRGEAGFPDGEWLGEGAAERSDKPRQSGSAKMKRRNLMGAAAARQP